MGTGLKAGTGLEAEGDPWSVSSPPIGPGWGPITTGSASTRTPGGSCWGMALFTASWRCHDETIFLNTSSWFLPPAPNWPPLNALWRCQDRLFRYMPDKGTLVTYKSWVFHIFPFPWFRRTFFTIYFNKEFVKLSVMARKLGLEHTWKSASISSLLILKPFELSLNKSEMR